MGNSKITLPKLHLVSKIAFNTDKVDRVANYVFVGEKYALAPFLYGFVLVRLDAYGLQGFPSCLVSVEEWKKLASLKFSSSYLSEFRFVIDRCVFDDSLISVSLHPDSGEKGEVAITVIPYDGSEGILKSHFGGVPNVNAILYRSKEVSDFRFISGMMFRFAKLFSIFEDNCYFQMRVLDSGVRVDVCRRDWSDGYKYAGLLFISFLDSEIIRNIESCVSSFGFEVADAEFRV